MKFNISINWTKCSLFNLFETLNTMQNMWNTVSAQPKIPVTATKIRRNNSNKEPGHKFVALTIYAAHFKSKWQNAKYVKLRKGSHTIQFESAYKS